ncbi:helix-turn-helix domain-containing protein [Heyndrickxia sp. FSL K6-6286]|uniref:helix-turn-helix domain-containing protein n=1 Tax=Heyndrickxia sp. FSL K6-6286 TaxID=2921510 RepID=UPI00315B0737
MQSFQSVKELDAAIRQHRAANELTKTELAVLDVLAQYSCVEPGVSYLRKSKIGEAIGKSRRTVIRACNRLESLGIIKQYKRKRETGDRRQTSNRIVIQPINVGTYQHISVRTEKNELVTPECHTEETPQLNSKSNNTYSNGALKRAVHSPLYDTLSPYFNDGELYRVIGVLYRAKASVDRNITIEEHTTEYIDAFKSVVYSHKLGNVRSLFGCLFAAWREVTTEIKRRMTLRSSPLFYDWLSGNICEG